MVNTEQKVVAGLQVYTVDLTYAYGPALFWIRSDMVVDGKASRVYEFTTAVQRDKREAASDAVTRIISSLQLVAK